MRGFLKTMRAFPKTTRVFLKSTHDFGKNDCGKPAKTHDFAKKEGFWPMSPASLSPPRGEGLRVRDDAGNRFGNGERFVTFPPLTPALSPLRGEGERKPRRGLTTLVLNSPRDSLGFRK
jgi:hypothetical protein